MPPLRIEELFHAKVMNFIDSIPVVASNHPHGRLGQGPSEPRCLTLPQKCNRALAHYIVVKNHGAWLIRQTEANVERQ
jgi:hypothetical protein